MHVFPNPVTYRDTHGTTVKTTGHTTAERIGRSKTKLLAIRSKTNTKQKILKLVKPDLE